MIINYTNIQKHSREGRETVDDILSVVPEEMYRFCHHEYIGDDEYIKDYTAVLKNPSNPKLYVTETDPQIDGPFSAIIPVRGDLTPRDAILIAYVEVDKYMNRKKNEILLRHLVSNSYRGR